MVRGEEAVANEESEGSKHRTPSCFPLASFPPASCPIGRAGEEEVVGDTLQPEGTQGCQHHPSAPPQSIHPDGNLPVEGEAGVQRLPTHGPAEGRRSRKTCAAYSPQSRMQQASRSHCRTSPASSGAGESRGGCRASLGARAGLVRQNNR